MRKYGKGKINRQSYVALRACLSNSNMLVDVRPGAFERRLGKESLHAFENKSCRKVLTIPSVRLQSKITLLSYRLVTSIREELKETRGTIHLTKISENVASKVNGSVRSKWKIYGKWSPSCSGWKGSIWNLPFHLSQYLTKRFPRTLAEMKCQWDRNFRIEVENTVPFDMGKFRKV